MKRKYRRQSGGSNQLNPLSLVLLGILLFLLYQLNQKPIIQEKIIQEKIIYSEPEVIIQESDDDEPYRENEYIPMQMRFNYPTRGQADDYEMVGYLQDSDDPNKLQQLYGRRTYPRSNQWNYFVKSDQYHQIPIPLTIDGQNCTDEIGCSELTNQETVNLMNRDHTATIYNLEPFRYNPYVY